MTWIANPALLVRCDAVCGVLGAEFDVDLFGGAKALVISTKSWLGGRNEFIGLCCLITGIVCIVMGAVLASRALLCPRELADPAALRKDARGSPIIL